MGCGAIGAVWCDICESKRIGPSHSGCPVCGLPRVFRKCPACAEMPFQFQAVAIAAYRPPLKEALIAFKYRPEIAFAEIVASWLEEKLRHVAWEVDLIIPVPLNSVRMRQRGYNQVELITSALARTTKILHGSSTLKRVRDTRSQVGLSPNARFANMNRAFLVHSACLHQERVLLIDDLLTTGATMIACARAILDAGASHVFAMAIARAG